MNDLGALYTRIEADTTGLDKAESKIKTFAKNAAASLAAVASVAAVANAVKEMTMLTARYDTLGIVMNNVGKNAGYSAAQMERYQQTLQKTGISMIAARSTMTKMAQAQIDLSKSSDLARIAQDAAVIGNINSSEAFERMINGIQSAEVEILRGIGLNVSFENSYNELAASLKKNAADLSEQEKTQARVNAVVKAGSLIQGTYAGAMDSAGKKWLSMQRYVEDTQVKLGRLFQPAFGTIVDAITEKLKSFGNSLNEKNLKDWSLKIQSAVKGVLDFAGAISKLSESLGSPNLKQLAMIGLVWSRFGPQAAIGTAAVMTFANGLENTAKRNEESKTKTVSALVAIQKQWEVFQGLRDKGGGSIFNVGELYSDIQLIENKIKELQNFKEPWQLFPDPAENARNAAAIKTQIEELKNSLMNAKIKEAIAESIADPWRSAEREVQAVMKNYTANTKRSLKAIESDYEKHRDAIFRINDQIKQNQMTGEQLIRDLKRETMTKGQAEADLKKEAQEYISLMEKAKMTWEALKNAKSKEDIAKKDAAFEDIIKYSEVAQEKYLEMDRTSAGTKAEVIKNIQAIVVARDAALQASKQVEVNAANALIKESDFTVASKLFEEVKTKANEVATVSYPAMGEAFTKVWQDGENAANIVFTNIDQKANETAKKISENLWVVPKNSEYTEVIDKLSGTFTKVYETAAKASDTAKKAQLKDDELLQAGIKEIDGVWSNTWDEASKAADAAFEKMLAGIKKVKQSAASIKFNSSGSGDNSGYSVDGYKTGGEILWNKARAIKASIGRFFPGFGGGDKIPILGEAGEHMINKYSVREAGPGTADAFNKGNWSKVISNLLPKVQSGGPSPMAFPQQALAFSGITNQSTNEQTESPRKYYIAGDQEPISVRADSYNADRLLMELDKKHRRRSR